MRRIKFIIGLQIVFLVSVVALGGSAVCQNKAVATDSGATINLKLAEGVAPQYDAQAATALEQESGASAAAVTAALGDTSQAEAFEGGHLVRVAIPGGEAGRVAMVAVLDQAPEADLQGVFHAEAMSAALGKWVGIMTEAPTPKTSSAGFTKAVYTTPDQYNALPEAFRTDVSTVERMILLDHATAADVNAAIRSDKSPFSSVKAVLEAEEGNPDAGHIIAGLGANDAPILIITAGKVDPLQEMIASMDDTAAARLKGQLNSNLGIESAQAIVAALQDGMKASSAGAIDPETLPKRARIELKAIEDALLAKYRTAEVARSWIDRQPRSPYKHLMAVFSAAELGSKANAFFAVVVNTDGEGKVELFKLPDIKHAAGDHFNYERMASIPANIQRGLEKARAALLTPGHNAVEPIATIVAAAKASSAGQQLQLPAVLGLLPPAVTSGPILGAILDANSPNFGAEIAFRGEDSDTLGLLAIAVRDRFVRQGDTPLSVGTVVDESQAIAAIFTVSTTAAEVGLDNPALTIVTPGLTLNQGNIDAIRSLAADRGVDVKIVLGVGSEAEAIQVRDQGLNPDAAKAFPFNPKNDLRAALKGPLPEKYHDFLEFEVNLVEKDPGTGPATPYATYSNILTAARTGQGGDFLIPPSGEELVSQIREVLPETPIVITGGVSPAMVSEGLLRRLDVSAALSMNVEKAAQIAQLTQQPELLPVALKIEPNPGVGLPSSLNPGSGDQDAPKASSAGYQRDASVSVPEGTIFPFTTEAQEAVFSAANATFGQILQRIEAVAKTDAILDERAISQLRQELTSARAAYVNIKQQTAADSADYIAANRNLQVLEHALAEVSGLVEYGQQLQAMEGVPGYDSAKAVVASQKDVIVPILLDINSPLGQQYSSLSASVRGTLDTEIGSRQRCKIVLVDAGDETAINDALAANHVTQAVGISNRQFASKNVGTLNCQLDDNYTTALPLLIMRAKGLSYLFTMDEVPADLRSLIESMLAPVVQGDVTQAIQEFLSNRVIYILPEVAVYYEEGELENLYMQSILALQAA